MHPLTYRIVDSPIGPLTLVGDDDALCRLHMEYQAHTAPVSPLWRRDDGAFEKAVEQLDAYFAGDLTDFDVPLRLEGTAFQKRVWEVLREIPYGETRSYGWVAERIGQPTAFRAVGLANGRNPVAVIVPCHRVIGASGSLVGYGGGLDRKVALLELEKEYRQPRLRMTG